MTEFHNPATLTDAERLDLYQQSGGEPGDPVVEALVSDIERRNLDL